LFNHFIIKALQNLLFCIPKAAVLHGKSVGFASHKRSYYFLRELSLQNQRSFQQLFWVRKRKLTVLISIANLIF